jgi:sugar phosphate isomerase/epimerase
MNNPIWLMTSAFPKLTLAQVVEKIKAVGAQGAELCVFRRDGSRRDHVATHLDYETFSLDDARRVLDTCAGEGIRISVGAYDNLLAGDPAECEANRNHILKLIRMAHLMGGDANDVCVGTFVGYNHELGKEDGGFAKNLDLYAKVFTPIVKYAESLGVTLTYENCPMEGWRPASAPTTYNNLPCTLAARKLMYALIPSKAHGETYDPSHDAWQNIDPVDVLKNTDFSRLHRVHIKGTRNRADSLAAIQWGRLYPMQQVDAALAGRAGVCQPAHEWDRHHYDPKLPGFGGSDSIDWFAFFKTLMDKGFGRPFVIENEADNSSHTGNAAATVQGFAATVLSMAPAVWPLDAEKGWWFNPAALPPLKPAAAQDIPVVTMRELV